MENIFEKRKIKNWQMKFGKLKKIFKAPPLSQKKKGRSQDLYDSHFYTHESQIYFQIIDNGYH